MPWYRLRHFLLSSFTLPYNLFFLRSNLFALLAFHANSTIGTKSLEFHYKSAFTIPALITILSTVTSLLLVRYFWVRISDMRHYITIFRVFLSPSRQILVITTIPHPHILRNLVSFNRWMFVMYASIKRR
jgi:hypothetical protein